MCRWTHCSLKTNSCSVVVILQHRRQSGRIPSKGTSFPFMHIRRSTLAELVNARAIKRKHGLGTSAHSRSIHNFPKRGKRWRNWNIDSHRVTVICHGGSEKNPDRKRVFGALFDFGLHLSLNSFLHSIDSAASNGRVKPSS